MNPLRRSLCGVLLTVSPALLGQCLTFPPSVIPLSSVSYVTAANSSGDQLVVGALTGGLNTLAQLPLPDSTNEAYCDSAVQLAPGQYYPNVYVPSAAERSGNFSAFAGLLVNPANNQPFPGGVIPASQLGSVYAFRIAASRVQQVVKPWSFTGSMAFARGNNHTVLLPSGKVLDVGGTDQVEVYDPATGLFSKLGPTSQAHGGDSTVTLLNDGRVLIVGGSSDPSSAEIFDPVKGSFVATAKPKLLHGVYHTATLLNDGRVLIVGGRTMPNYANSTSPDINSGAELFDPKIGSFVAAGPMSVNRNSHIATLLQDGRVLIAGGAPSGTIFGVTNSAEVFDPAKSAFSATGFMGAGRVRPYAFTLPNGQVLVGGGYGGAGSAELFDTGKNSFSYTGSMSFERYDAQATLLSSGQVLVVGGYGNFAALASSTRADLYTPSTGTFSLAGEMNKPRNVPSISVLLDGRVLVTGGSDGCCGLPYTATASAEIYTPTIQGLVTSQTGLTFRAAQSSASVAPQTLAVLSPTDDIPWNVSVKTYSGGNWLSASPSSSDSKPGAAPVTLTVTVDPTGLAPQDYYGAVTLTPSDQKHPPITVSVVFSIVPAGTAAPLQVSPTGLVFLTKAGVDPAPQSFKATNFTNRAVNFTATSSSTFFTFSPTAGTITTSLPGTITVAPSAAKLTAGVYRGSIKLAFSDSSTQNVDVLMVVSAAPAGSSNERGAAAACAPTKLLPVLTSVASGSIAPIAWPTPVQVQLVDDCGNAINSGNVTASFTNGDPPISLLSIGNATWSGTWVPVHTSAGTTVRVDSRLLQPALSGTVQVPVQVAANPKVPVVATGGVLSSGDYASPPAAGLLVSIFGSELADGSTGFTQVPLPTQLGSTQVLLGGVALPMVYVSANQVNVLVPFEAPLNAPLPLLVTRANAISVPVTVAVFDAQPAILATAGNGQGQGHIYRATSSAQILADGSAPATAGETLVIYCVGMGAVTPAVQTGYASPASPLATVAGQVTVTIGGQSVKPAFAGLTPGYVGLYQVNVVVPSSIAPGAQVPVNVSVGAKSSPAGITMGVK